MKDVIKEKEGRNGDTMLDIVYSFAWILKNKIKSKNIFSH